MQRLLSIIAAVIFVASSASTADAAALSIKLCNQYRQVTDFALALQEKGSWTSMFSFTQSPTYVGNSTRHVTFTMLKDGSHMTWQ